MVQETHTDVRHKYYILHHYTTATLLLWGLRWVQNLSTLAFTPRGNTSIHLLLFLLLLLNVIIYGGTVVQQVTLLPHSSQVASSIVSSRYCLCGVSYSLPMSMWDSSLPETSRWISYAKLPQMWLCVHGAMWWTGVPSKVDSCLMLHHVPGMGSTAILIMIKFIAVYWRWQNVLNYFIWLI